MGLFHIRKPRRFNLSPIYVDERKEKLQRIEQKAKRDLGMYSEKETSSEQMQVAFTEKSEHLQRYSENQRKGVWIANPKVLLFLLFILIIVWMALS